MSRTRVICPCGVPVSMPELYHRNKVKPHVSADAVCHDCIWHNSPQCRVCVTYTQIEAYLDVVLACGEDEANQVLDEELARKRKQRHPGGWIGAWE